MSAFVMFQMSHTPNQDLGVLPVAFPPSPISLDPANVQAGAALASAAGHARN